MKHIQIDKLSENTYNKIISKSFNRLPNTNHKDGKYRLRRYSVIELRTTHWNGEEQATIERLPQRTFVQNNNLNNFQGNVVRKFEEIEEDVLQNEGFKEICLAFRHSYNFTDGQELEVHQLRVVVLDNEFPDGTPVAPEGVHRDGFDYIAMIGINRNNISGGELMVYESKDGKPMIKTELKNGQIIMLNDKEFFHYASVINRVDKSKKEGHGDWFIICAKNDVDLKAG